MNKRLSILFIFMLVFQTISSGLFLPSQTVAEGSEQSIFTGISYTDEDGEVINIDEVDGESAVNVHVDWSIAHVEIEAGSTESFYLPDELYVEGEQQGELTDGEVEVGTYQVAVDGSVTVGLDEGIAENPEAAGTFVVNAVLTGEEDEGQPGEFVERDGVAEDQEDTSQQNEVETTNKEEVVTEEETEAQEEETLVDEAVVEEETATEEENERSIGTFAEIEENIFSFHRLTLNGDDVEDGSVIDLSDGTEAELVFDWDTEGLSVQEGDTASMQLPDTFDQITTPATPLVTSGITVGTYSIQNGELIFVFNENIEDGNVSNGEVGLNLNFNLEVFEENIEQVIPFNDSQNTELNVTAIPFENASDITKEGHPDQSHNASEITWTLDVMNNSDEAVSNATLSDILPGGLGTPDNFVVTELSTGLNGDKVEGGEVDISPNVDGNEFNIAFDNMDPYKGYRIEYSTSVDDRDATEFTNDATFFNGEEDLPADVTVSGLTASNPVEKSGDYNSETGQIDWTIVANENGFNIENAIIEDELPAGLTVDGETLTVGHYVDGFHVEDLELETNDFPINLGETTSNEHYVIDFSTNIDYAEVNEGEYQDTSSFINSAILNNGDNELARDNATVEVERDPLLEKAGESLVDYDNKTLSWSIDVNRAKHSLTDLVITDLIPAGLSISEGDIEITSDEEGDISAENISITGNEGEEQEIVITLGDIGTQHITIDYTTEIVDFTVNEFNNTVGIGGDGIGEGDYDTGHEINPPGNDFGKSHQGTDYSERKMEWQLTVNPQREALDELEIVDTFTNDGLILLPETLNITLGEQDITDDVNLSPNSEDGETGYHKGFTLDFDESILPINNNMIITYETSYDPQREVEGNTLDPHVNDSETPQSYVNHVQFTGITENGNNFDLGREASDEVREDSWNSGKKEGQLVNVDSEGNQTEEWQSGSERMIAWQLYTNYQQQALGADVVITDTLEYAGEIDEDSIRISEYEVKSNGETKVTKDVTDSLEYTLEVDGDEFTLTFNQEVSERYVVEFLTTVPNVSEETYTNGATVTVDEEDYPYTGTVDYENYDNFLDKSAIGQEGNEIYIGEELNWEVQVNDSLSVINNAVIRDIMSNGLEYVQGSLEVTTGSGNTLSEGLDYILTTNETANDTILTIELNDTLSESLTLNYTTVVTAEDGATVNNNVALNGDNIENVTVEYEKLTAEQFSWVDGEFNENRGALSIVKSDSETGDPIANNPATFELYYELNDERVLFADEIETDENGEVTIGNLPLRTYYIQEVEAPTGYIIDEEEQEIDVTNPYGTNEYVYDVDFSNTIEKTDITVTKEWEDENDQDGKRPSSIQVQLEADGESHGDPVTLDGPNWSFTWTDLDAYQSNGEAIDYTVEEVNIPEGYEPTTSDINEDGEIIITNSYEPETTDIAVNKVWNDEENQDNVRPNNVTVNLLADGEIERQTVLNEDNEWNYQFTDLPVYEDGREINYTITEDAVTHYSTVVESIGTEEEPVYTITNSYTPEETSVTVTKSWNDDNNRDGNRPTEIQLQLLSNGEPHGDPVTVDQSNWTYTWSELAANADGEPVEYTVEEVDVPEGYDVNVNNSNHGNIMITNSYDPETTEIAVSKEWDDADNQDGNRPSNVTVNLLGNGEVVKTTVLDDVNDWNHTFANLPVYENGEEITYRVTENNVEGYSTSIDGSTNNGFVITNSYTPEETTATITKSWNDGENQDANRPGSIQVQLYANGTEVGDPVDVTASDEWTYTWSGLDAYTDGEAITYTVEELNVPEDYTVTVNNNDHGNLMITNNYTPEGTEIPVTKGWDDDDDRDHVRPNTVTVNLLADGEIVRRAVLNEARDWEHVFNNLPVYENGTEIDYSLTENTVPEYSTSVEPNENGFVVTNSYTPEETTATVTKNWNDADNQDGIRPETIEVQLLANDEEAGDPVEVTAEDGWTYTWEGLPLNADGEPINYSVEELNVTEGYETTLNDEDHGNLILTNNHTPEEINVSGTKTWNDADNQDGIRPTTITVNLFANDDFVESVDVTEADEWSYSFDDLPKFEAGEEIDYTITEDEVEGYETELDGFDITNTHTPKVIDVSGTKTWDDVDNQDGIRPDTITVNLLADGEQVNYTEVTEEDNWSYSFTDLPKFEAGEEIVYTVTENTVEDYTQTIDGFDITNEYTPSETAVTITKDWDDANNQDGIRPETIEVQLTADGDDQGEPVVLSESNNWTHTWTELDEMASGETIAYSVVEVTELPEYETSINDEDHGNIIITNSYTPETTEVAGTKTWDDADNQDGIRPESITVNLHSDGVVVDSVEVTAEEEWSYQFTDLSKYEAGEEIAYTITEDAVEGYEVSIDGFDLTNTHTPEVIDVTGTKTWDDADNQDGIRPEAITVNLHANGNEEAINSVEVTAEDNWEYSFGDLPKYEAGEEITYTISEEDVEGYETEINGFNITNSYTPETTEVTGEKTWNDADNQDGNRPDTITVNLLADGEQIRSTEVTAESDWVYHFTDLPKYEAGEEITYTVTENTVADYTQTIDGFDITNQYTPGQTAVTVTKNWNDANNQDNIRPETIEVQLTADGENQGAPVELSEANNWTHTWTELDEKAAGETIDYSVVELTEVPEYETTVNDADHGNIIITNSYKPEEIEISGTKTWEDANNQENTRPESITVNVLANGEVVHSTEVTEAEDWNYSFTNLPKYEAGKEIDYSISENPVEGYESTVEGYDITNTLIPEKETTTPGPTDSDTEGTTEVSTTDDETGTGDRMPDTATNIYNMLLIGMALLAIGFTLRMIYRKQKTV